MCKAELVFQKLRHWVNAWVNALRLSALTVAMIIAGISAVGQVSADILSAEHGDLSLDTRIFYFDRSFDKPDTPDSEALTGGGILKYETESYKNTGFGLAYYASYSLFGIVDRSKGTGTALLQEDGDDISFLGEAYIDYDNGTNQVKIGLQRLSTPLIQDRDIRLLPSVYEAAVYRYHSQHDAIFELGYVNAYSGTGSSFSDFKSNDDEWGTDGLGYIFIKGNPGPVAIRGQFVDTLEDSGTVSGYGYIDASYPIEFGEKTFISGQFGHTGYQQADSAKMYGLNVGTSIGKIDIAAVFNAIRDNEFRTVEAGPLYTDWQQGYANYEPSDAAGFQVVFYPIERSSVKLGYVDVNSRDGDEFNLDSYGEVNIDARYQINEPSSIRLRYSEKKQDSDSEREDRTDFRVIYYYNF